MKVDETPPQTDYDDGLRRAVKAVGNQFRTNPVSGKVEPVGPYAEPDVIQPVKTEVESKQDAIKLLNNARDIMIQRGKDYDNPQGERSMEQIVGAFNAISGSKMTEAEGWLFMECLKNVRQWQAKGYHQDSAEDGIAYSALKAECLSRGGVKHIG